MSFFGKHHDYSELKEKQHGQALEATFSETEVYGYGDLTEALRRGYATIGCKYGENKRPRAEVSLQSQFSLLKHFTMLWVYR